MVTFFSIAKPFRDQIRTIQRNAIASWLGVCPGAEVVLYGDDYGTLDACSEFRIRYGGPIGRSEFGRHLVSDAFRRIAKDGARDILAYINCDIIVLDDFRQMLGALARAGLREYLLSARRHCLSVEHALPLAHAAERRTLRAEVSARARLDGPSAMDCFVFPRTLEFDLPPFSVGEIAWDNWMVYSARSRRIPVIDATPDCMLIHQDHAPAFPGRSPDADRNLSLAGGLAKLGTLRDADWVLQEGVLKRPGLVRGCYRAVQDWPMLRPLLHIRRAANQRFGRQALRHKTANSPRS
jgi:hypothetical protein